MKKRVVITGMEIVSSIGSGIENFWHAATQGQSGIRRIQAYDPSPYSTQIAGEIINLDLSHLPEVDKPKRYPRVAQFALFCAHSAVQQSGLTAAELSDAATYIGTSMGGTPELESVYQLFFEDSWRKMPALSIIRGMPNSVANHIAIAFGAKGLNSTISNACVSSAEAIGNAFEQIAYGKLRVALCGGTESLIWESIMAGWCKLRAMSRHNENPAMACRPFDSLRDGMVMADGAGILILEEYEHARARGAHMIAEITGFGASCDGYHITAPSSDGQVRAIRAALEEARVSPNDIQYINAHGTGTPLNDVTETQSIQTVFEEHAYHIPISAQKSMTGHAIGAAGVMEIIATALSLERGVLLPTINLHHPDPACPLDYIPNVARHQRVDIALSNHFAFGGANVALIVQRV